MADRTWTSEEIARITGGSLVGAPDAAVRRVVHDTREDSRDALFVCIKGERFDGHEFLAAAVEGGATAALVTEARNLSTPQIVVDDTIAALQRLGQHRRAEWGRPLAGVTGSTGKTTTRRILAALLSAAYDTHQPTRNFNNHIGVPLTLLGLRDHHERAVIELGCSDFGEIALLTGIAQPSVGLVTNVGPAHLERLGDLDGVARAKGELFAGLPRDATAVVNLDDPRVRDMPRACERVVFYSTDPRNAEATVTLKDRTSSGRDGQQLLLGYGARDITVTLPLVGMYNALDGLAAAAAAYAFDLDADALAGGFRAVSTEPRRLEIKRGIDSRLLIDDTYNANPASMAAALEALVETADDRPRVAVLGDMLELGESSEDAHLSIGRLVAEKRVELLITFGPGGALIARGAFEAGMNAQRIHQTFDHEQTKQAADGAATGSVILFKGSRGVKLERVVDQLVTTSGKERA